MAKVLHVIRSLDPGGAERVVVEYVLAHDRARYEPEVCCVLGEGPLAELVRKAGVPVHVLSRLGRSDIRAVLPLARLIRRGGFDVVHNHNFGPIALGVPAAVMGGARAVLRTEHNMSVRQGPAWFCVSRLAALREDAQISVSRAALESHLRSGRIPSERFVTVWNGIDDARLGAPDDRAAVRRELGLSADAVVCLTIGSLTAQKNYWDLLEAAKLASRARPDVRFLVVGGGPLEGELRTRARELGVDDVALFLGQRLDVPRLFRAADIFVLSSSWEGLPITVLESMAAGVPCIATAVGGISEILTDGVSGCLVKANDPEALARQIGLLAANPDLRARLAERARAAFEKSLTAKSMVRQTEALYDLALSGRADLAPPGRIKIVYVIGQLDCGGAERQLLELATRLPRSVFEPVVCSLRDVGPIGQEMEKAGVRVVPLRKRPGIFSFCTLALYRLVRAERPAILHTYLFSAGWRGLLVARLTRVPVAISSARNVDIHGSFLLTAFERLLAHITDLVIANAESVKEYVSRAHGIAAAKIHVIYNGISMDRIARGVASAAAGIASDRWGVGLRTVAMIASLTPKKDHETFLSAARIVRNQLPETRFLVVGDGALRARLEARVREMGLEESVIFTGEIDDAAALLAAVDVSVLTSLKEGCSNTVLESMAAGKPVVATRVGGTPELVDDGVTGFVAPAGDAEGIARRVIELLSDPDLRRRMGDAGRARAWERFGAERMVEETTELYLSILRERVRGLVEWVEATEARGGPRALLPRRGEGFGLRSRRANDRQA